MLDITNLPEKYLESMKKLLGGEYPLYIESLGKKAYSGVRVNTLKIAPQRFKELFKNDFKPVPWTSNGFYTTQKTSLSKNPYYHAGLYYLQEPSAMAPAALADIKPHSKVLDLCAAPGGKSTEAAARLGGDGLLVSNDISATRAKALLKNLELTGAGNIIITCEKPENLVKCFSGYFDSIILDAPCSGEGMFRKDRAVLEEYKKRGPEAFTAIQAQLIDIASRLLKPGGSIIYSTCTYSVAENEDVVGGFLRLHNDFYLEPIDIYKGFYNSTHLEGSVRLFPHRIGGEGHFIAKIKRRKKDEDTDIYTYEKEDLNYCINKYTDSKVSKNKSVITKKKHGKRVETTSKIPESCMEFLKHIYRNWDRDRFYINREYIYYLPEFYVLDNNLHYLRTGLLLGRIKNLRFEPSQALAMNLKADEWDNPLDLDIDDNRVIKYLKGETIEDTKLYDGFRLVCVCGYPLGFVKQSGYKCKNKYYPGWRMT
ncbi:RsmB/NOP family class I SAM-dependent RNA methyltransferase [Johnsonella ignava]|uniref:RsmB/NOP family class I SAM-dependent RNA methyltransferase n=1 Tax=Johnsonella ignava TaxID=43995 RepID=UPI0023F39B8C|nr:RsmB/NOP family class I SAM-dependent RNA methyltransferase [Johnsonella ignava]